MPKIITTPGQLGALIKRDGAAFSKAIRTGARNAALRSKRHLVQVTKGMGKTDTGIFQNSWTIVERPDGSVILTNTAPYAGIIEAGARPHPVSEEGREAIAAWVRRKILSGYQTGGLIGPAQKGGDASYGTKSRKLTRQEREDADVDHIVDGICWKLLHHGQKGTWIVRDALPILAGFLNTEINAAIAKKVES